MTSRLRLLFAAFAWAGRPSIAGLAMVISADNIAMGIAGTALIARVTRKSLAALRLAPGLPVYALIKSVRSTGTAWVGRDARLEFARRRICKCPLT